MSSGRVGVLSLVCKADMLADLPGTPGKALRAIIKQLIFMVARLEQEVEKYHDVWWKRTRLAHHGDLHHDLHHHHHHDLHPDNSFNHQHDHHHYLIQVWLLPRSTLLSPCIKPTSA